MSDSSVAVMSSAAQSSRSVSRSGCPPIGAVAGRGTTIGNAIAPVLKLTSNTPIFERMKNDLDINAGTVIDGTESIEQVGRRVFEHVIRTASGEVQAKAEVQKHREFQVWAEQSVSL